MKMFIIIFVYLINLLYAEGTRCLFSGANKKKRKKKELTNFNLIKRDKIASNCFMLNVFLVTQ